MKTRSTVRNEKIFRPSGHVDASNPHSRHDVGDERDSAGPVPNVKKPLDRKNTFMAFVEHYDLSQLPTTVHGPCHRVKFGQYTFGPKEINMLGASGLSLNDECINGLAAFFQCTFCQYPGTSAFAEKCALFSSFDLAIVQKKESDEKLWRNTKRTRFWEKKVWIIPIYRPRQFHWVLAIISFEENRHQICLFDSLALVGWLDDLEDVWNFIARLSKVSTRNNHPLSDDPTGQAWIVERPFRTALQSNGYDCGLWVLAWVVDALRGRDPALSQINEVIMTRWRLVLGNLVQRHWN